jgi:hypothetical protein
MAVIIIKSNTSSAGIDMGFEAMCVKYRDLIADYCTKHKIMINELISNSGCADEKMMKDFLSEGRPIPTGKDLERLLGETCLKQRFAEEVPVVLGSDVIYPVALCGTVINEKTGDKGRHVAGDAVPEEVDMRFRDALAKNMWFYLQASQRYLEAQGI